MDSKSSRPFVGILLTIHGMSYYAPLSSPKPKHRNMSNQVDLLKINGGEYGVINLNNMIPIHNNSISLINLGTLSTDSQEDVQYKELLRNQLSWCNANKDRILNKAQKLYEMIENGNARQNLIERCCKFIEDEELLKEYCTKKGWTI